MTRLAPIMLLTLGCGLTPPEHFSIDPDFNEAQQAVMRDAVAAWCEAVEWCPCERPWAPWPIQEGAIRLVTGESLRERRCVDGSEGCLRGGHNDGWSITIDDWIASEPDLLWLAAAHELGHFCIQEHTHMGLMSAQRESGDPLVVDTIAVRAWIHGCN